MSVDPTIFGVSGFVFPVATTDYPAVGDVAAGVAYNFGTLTGTRTDADPADVRYGETYGDPGDLFTGTLYVPATGGTGLVANLRQITRQIPDLVTVTYEPRTGGSTFGTAAPWEARRQPLTSTDADGLASRTCRWQLYATAEPTQTVKPARMGRITGPDGVKYEVGAVLGRFGQLIFDCDCVQDV
jgi:hypothetical protein